MKTRKLLHLKGIVAARRGLAPEEVSDRDAISHYRTVWASFLLGLFLVVGFYLLLRVTWNRVAARSFVALVAMAVTLFCFLRLRLSARLRHGLLRETKDDLAEKMSTNPSGVSDEMAKGYDLSVWRGLAIQVSGLLLASFVANWLWPTATLELVVLILFYAMGAVVFRELSALRHPFV